MLSVLIQRRSEPVARKRWAVLNHTYNLLLDKSVRRVRAARPSSAQAPSCSRLRPSYSTSRYINSFQVRPQTGFVRARARASRSARSLKTDTTLVELPRHEHLSKSSEGSNRVSKQAHSARRTPCRPPPKTTT